MVKLEPVIVKEKPDIVIVVGDVNSTVAAALVSVKLGIKVAHIEAGIRSYDRRMSEEINRIITDQLSDFLFITSKFDKENLLREGIDVKKIFLVGNIMTDTLLHMPQEKKQEILQKFNLPERYGFLTLHRAENVDNKKRFAGILQAIQIISENTPLLFPIHPRTQKTAKEFGLFSLLKSPNIFLVPPISYRESVSLVKNAQFVITDSGGLQHETTILGVPCFTVRENTEWPITIQRGTNQLVGVTKNEIIKSVLERTKKKKEKISIPYWDGKTAERIVAVLDKTIS